MDSPPPQAHDSLSHKDKEVYAVDPFLKEALQNPRHRLTILRMELDIQRFMQNPDQQQFEFPHFPTSYLRLAAHRVAQHYGLQSMVLDNSVDGLGTRIVVRKTAESRNPSICLSEVPAEQPENEKPEHVKIAIRTRPKQASPNNADEAGTKRSPTRTVEERKEEYDRARARIFSGSSSPDLEGAPPAQTAINGRIFCSSRDESSEGFRNVINEPEKSPIINRDGSTSTSRVAIFRDREKDRSDPDYDRSYERYIRGVPLSQNFSLGPFNVQSVPPSFMQYEAGFPQTSGDAVYMQWPSPAMMHMQSYDPFRHTVFQAPFYHQPLSFDYSQNH